MNFRIVIYLIAVTITACSTDSKKGYTELSPDLAFKLQFIGESNTQIGIGDYISTHFQYLTLDDSVFFESFRKFQVKGNYGAGSIIPALLKMSEGDSASLIVNTLSFFTNIRESEVPNYLLSHSEFRIEIRIDEIQSRLEFNQEKRMFMEWIDEFHTSESELIKRYITNSNLEVSQSESGLYFIPLKVGNNKKVKRGKRVWIHYTGRFLNGHFIDNSNTISNPVDYVYGTEMYLIDGLNEALGRMYEGEKALVILPSELAFGSFGSAGGIIPPYTTLIYELEVLKVE